MDVRNVLVLLIGLGFGGCNQQTSTTTNGLDKSLQAYGAGRDSALNVQNSTTLNTSTPGEKVEPNYDPKDKEEIQNLIRQVLNWAHSKNTIDLTPGLLDNQHNSYAGFDLVQLTSNLAKLKATGYFSGEFIENYNHIILTLNKKLKANQYSPWLVNELPPFPFANDVDIWCMCQDVPYDKPSPWDYLEVEIIRLDGEHAEAIWRCGKIELNNDPGWRDFAYKFRATREDAKWKIAYLEGFDYEESI